MGAMMTETTTPRAFLDIADYSLTIDGDDGPIEVLKNIDLTLHKGETLGIVGESGSGKTVLVRSLMGIGPKRSRVTGGRVSFDGQDITRLSDREWRGLRGVRISMVFQDPMTYLNPLITVGRQISDVLRAQAAARGQAKPARAECRAVTVALLADVGIAMPERVFDSYPHQLSGGMRQRILIAIALSAKPDLLIADEPTTALDVTVQAQVLALIREIVQRFGLTVIIISHDIGAVATIAGRIAVMYKGEIVEQGPTAEILSAPQQPYTQQLLAALPDVNSPATPREAGAGAEPLLQVRGLTKRFGSGDKLVVASDRLDFDLARGEVLGVVGESGSGKSTMARLILRLIEPDAGSVRFKGQDIVPLPAEAMRRLRRQMQFVFQNPDSALNPRHLIGDAIAEPLYLQEGLRGSRLQREVERLLDQVHLPRNFRFRYPHELSGGQKQRVCIARALSLRPELLVLDEPTSALDVSVQAKVLELLAEIRRDAGLSYLFISHDLAVIKDIADRVLVMRKGAIIEQGATEQVFNRPAQDYTRELLESARVTSVRAGLERALA